MGLSDMDYWFVYMVDPYGNIRIRYRNKNAIPKWCNSVNDIGQWFVDKFGKGYGFKIYEIWKSDTFDHYNYWRGRSKGNIV